MKQKVAIIFGAGPAGLTAAYELLKRTDIKPIIYEMSADVGGIAKTVNYKGNRIDIGGHRFFSKSDRITQWWLNILPLQSTPAKPFPEVSPEKIDPVMLIRRRISRIFYLRRFFNYPVHLNFDTFSNLGVVRTAKIMLSYISSMIFPIKEERNLEDFFINRFSKELYRTFFKGYTEKVWGIPCKEIDAQWGHQRVKGLSILKAIVHALKKIFLITTHSINHKNVETSLIDQFMYPKFGPGQMWEEVAKIIQEKGGEIYLKHKIVGITRDNAGIQKVEIQGELPTSILTVSGDYFFSTMPIKDLIHCFDKKGVPLEVNEVAQGLKYRDFITIGLLLNKLKIKNESKIKTINNIIPDNWIYVQENEVSLARIQIFNNWSPYLVKDKNTVWLGLEYFCNKGDELWNKSDEEFKAFAIDELVKIGFIDKEAVLDNVVIRMPKAYPMYNGTYKDIGVVRKFLEKSENLFLIGRNGLHHYNNQDHSMLTAMISVDNIINGIKSKNNIWEINTEPEYHEKKN